MATEIPGLPANWLLVFAERTDTGELQRDSDAAKMMLYDASNDPPSTLLFIAYFRDTDEDVNKIDGVFEFMPLDGSDLGFTTRYEIYRAEDSIGTLFERRCTLYTVRTT